MQYVAFLFALEAHSYSKYGPAHLVSDYISATQQNFSYLQNKMEIVAWLLEYGLILARPYFEQWMEAKSPPKVVYFFYCVTSAILKRMRIILARVRLLK